MFNGPEQTLDVYETADDDSKAVGAWLAAWAAEGARSSEMGVFVRFDSELDRARAAVAAAGMESQSLDDRVEAVVGRVAVGTIHLLEGPEFKAVAVMACDGEVTPLQSRIESVATALTSSTS